MAAIEASQTVSGADLAAGQRRSWWGCRWCPEHDPERQCEGSERLKPMQSALRHPERDAEKSVSEGVGFGLHHPAAQGHTSVKTKTLSSDSQGLSLVTLEPNV